MSSKQTASNKTAPPSLEEWTVILGANDVLSAVGLLDKALQNCTEDPGWEPHVRATERWQADRGVVV